VNGYKRGSKELGVPTANIEMNEDNIVQIKSLLPGIYCGIVQFLSYESLEDELKLIQGDEFPDK
jgi:FAD synthase